MIISPSDVMTHVGEIARLHMHSGLDSTVGWRCRIDVINAWYSGSDELFSDA